MDSNFLKAADRGQSRLKDYAFAFLAAILSLLGFVFFLSFIVAIYRLTSGLPLEEFSLKELSCHSELLFACVIYFLLTSILFWVTLKIHKRHPKTLINTGEAIRLKRALSGFLVWFLIRVLSSFLLYLFYPDRYSVSDISKIDLSVTALGLIVCLLASILGAVAIAYILQGLNQLVKDSLLSIVYLILCVAAIFIFSKNNFQVLNFLFGILNFLFFIFMMVKEEGVELNIGWLMSNAFYVNFCVSLTIETGNPLFSRCPTLFVAQPIPKIVGFLVSIAQIAIFYYLFLVDRDRSQIGAN